MSYLVGVDPKSKMEMETDKCKMQVKNLTYMLVSRTNTCQTGSTIKMPTGEVFQDFQTQLGTLDKKLIHPIYKLQVKDCVTKYKN